MWYCHLFLKHVVIVFICEKERGSFFFFFFFSEVRTELKEVEDEWIDRARNRFLVCRLGQMEIMFSLLWFVHWKHGGFWSQREREREILIYFMWVNGYNDFGPMLLKAQRWTSWLLAHISLASLFDTPIFIFLLSFFYSLNLIIFF